MKKILVVLTFSLAAFAKTVFIEGIDNKFMCDGKQSSGGGFQKCGKITALKPMTLCFSSPSGMKCKKLEPNETLDTEVDTSFADNKNDDEEKKKNTTVKNDIPKPSAINPLDTTDFNNKEIDIKVDVQKQLTNLEKQVPSVGENLTNIKLASLFNFNTISTSENGTSPYNEWYDTIFSYKESTNELDILIVRDIDPHATDFGVIDLRVSHYDGSFLTDDLLTKTNSTTHTFQGEVYGSVITSSNSIEQIIQSDPSNELIMNFDFGGGTNNMDGTLKFQTASTSWDTTLSSNISANDFTANINSGTTNVSSGSLYGKFVGNTRLVEDAVYTDTITSVAGNFSITDDLNNQARGLFSATNSPNDVPTLTNYTLNGFKMIIDNNGNIVDESFTDPYQIMYDLNDNPLVDDDSSWGYWNHTEADYITINKYSQVKGLVTNTSIIDNLIDINTPSKSFTFDGGVIGTVFTAIDPDNPPLLTVGERAPNIEDIITDSTNSLQMTFDLGGGANNMTGTMAFKTASTSWDVNLSSSHAQISNSGFTGDITSGDTIVTSGSLEGKFFGRDEIKSVGGKFDITNSNGDIAAGVFKTIE